MKASKITLGIENSHLKQELGLFRNQNMKGLQKLSLAKLQKLEQNVELLLRNIRNQSNIIAVCREFEGDPETRTRICKSLQLREQIDCEMVDLPNDFFEPNLQLCSSCLEEEDLDESQENQYPQAFTEKGTLFGEQDYRFHNGIQNNNLFNNINTNIQIPIESLAEIKAQNLKQYSTRILTNASNLSIVNESQNSFFDYRKFHNIHDQVCTQVQQCATSFPVSNELKREDRCNQLAGIQSQQIEITDFSSSENKNMEPNKEYGSFQNYFNQLSNQKINKQSSQQQQQLKQHQHKPQSYNDNPQSITPSSSSFNSNNSTKNNILEITAAAKSSSIDNNQNIQPLELYRYYNQFLPINNVNNLDIQEQQSNIHPSRTITSSCSFQNAQFSCQITPQRAHSIDNKGRQQQQKQLEYSQSQFIPQQKFQQINSNDERPDLVNNGRHPQLVDVNNCSNRVPIYDHMNIGQMNLVESVNIKSNQKSKDGRLLSSQMSKFFNSQEILLRHQVDMNQSLISNSDYNKTISDRIATNAPKEQYLDPLGGGKITPRVNSKSDILRYTQEKSNTTNEDNNYKKENSDSTPSIKNQFILSEPRKQEQASSSSSFRSTSQYPRTLSNMKVSTPLLSVQLFAGNNNNVNSFGNYSNDINKEACALQQDQQEPFQQSSRIQSSQRLSSNIPISIFDNMQLKESKIAEKAKQSSISEHSSHHNNNANLKQERKLLDKLFGKENKSSVIESSSQLSWMQSISQNSLFKLKSSNKESTTHATKRGNVKYQPSQKKNILSKDILGSIINQARQSQSATTFNQNQASFTQPLFNDMEAELNYNINNN